MMHETLKSSKAPKAVGPYSPAVKIGDFILLSGQLPIDPSTNKVVEGGIVEQTKQCLENMKHILEEAGIDMSYVLKTTVFIRHIEDFKAMNEVYASYFREPYPARSAVEVSNLVGDALVEIEAYAIDTRALEVLCNGEDTTCNGTCCTTNKDIS